MQASFKLARPQNEPMAIIAITPLQCHSKTATRWLAEVSPGFPARDSVDAMLVGSTNQSASFSKRQGIRVREAVQTRNCIPAEVRV